MASGKIFVDTSVLIAALLSPTGGSSYVFETYRDRYGFVINEHVLKETLRILADKLDDKLTAEDFFRLAKSSRLKVVLNPPPSALKPLDTIIERADRPILASALERADYLLTLDNHFFSETVLRYATARGVRIIKPKELIALHR